MFLKCLDRAAPGGGYAPKLGQIAHQRRLHRSKTLDKTPFHATPNPVQLILQLTYLRSAQRPSADRLGCGTWKTPSVVGISTLSFRETAATPRPAVGSGGGETAPLG